MYLSEGGIIHGCKQRKRKAQKALFEKYHPILMGVCLRYAKNKSEAEDVLLMGFTKIFKKIKLFDGHGSFEGWMRRIIVNMAIDNYRKNFKYYFNNDIDEIHDSLLPFDQIPDTFSVKEILETIQALPSGYRIVFNLFAIEGYTHHEIAEMLNISESTSKSQLRKARKKLQLQLSHLHQADRTSTKKIERSEITFTNPQFIFHGK